MSSWSTLGGILPRWFSDRSQRVRRASAVVCRGSQPVPGQADRIGKGEGIVLLILLAFLLIAGVLVMAMLFFPFA